MNSGLCKLFILFIYAICLSTQMHGQVSRSNFKGFVVDGSDQPATGATLMVLNAADSVLLQFGTTDTKGAFLLKNVPKGEFLLNITFLGLAPFFQPIVSGTAEEIDLGKIIMQNSSTLLKEVEVKADVIPIEITKDTISYNADAFKTQPNANVEDLLKKLVDEN